MSGRRSRTTRRKSRRRMKRMKRMWTSEGEDDRTTKGRITSYEGDQGED
jgi:hypothetical protein